MTEETKHDLLLRRVQLGIAILAGLATLILGVYNIKKNMFDKPEPPPAPKSSEPAPGSKLASALEEYGADWIRSKAKKG